MVSYFIYSSDHEKAMDALFPKIQFESVSYELQLQQRWPTFLDRKIDLLFALLGMGAKWTHFCTSVNDYCGTIFYWLPFIVFQSVLPCSNELAVANNVQTNYGIVHREGARFCHII